MSKRRALTSEVGSATSPNNMQEMWREFFAQQSNNLVDIVRSLQVPVVNETRKVCLPKFDSNAAESDAAAWCVTADVIMADKPLEGSALIMALSAALSGDASQWLTQICFPEITWGQFRNLFLQRFGHTDTSAAEVMNLLNSKPKTGECLAAFGNRLVTTLEAKWKAKTIQEIAVAVVLASLTRVDNRLQRLACTTEIKTRAELQHELLAYSYTNEQTAVPDDFQPKKFKTANLIKCHFCGKLGHKMSECRSRKEHEKNKPALPLFTPKKKTITCYKCGVEGHVSALCPKRSASGTTEKRVDICQVVEPRGTMQNNGECFEYYFDSGAEVSLVKEFVAAKLSGKRFNNIVGLKGIGNAAVCSVTQILSTVNIKDLFLIKIVETSATVNIRHQRQQHWRLSTIVTKNPIY